jgi:hypothetical protein
MSGKCNRWFNIPPTVIEDFHKIYNIDLQEDLLEVNSVVCEELNYWFGLYKHAMKHMNSDRYNFFMYIILDIYNNEKMRLNERKYNS